MTEFDEQSDSKSAALYLLRLKMAQYRRGEETMGVVAGYEAAAFAKGATHDEIEAVLNEWRTDYENRRRS